jgi:hypothetical protein
MTLWLKTISVRDPVSLLAKAGRLGYRETDIVEGDAADPPVHEADDGLNVSFASTLLAEGHCDSTTSAHPSPVEASREPKCRKRDEHGSLGVNNSNNVK